MKFWHFLILAIFISSLSIIAIACDSGSTDSDYDPDEEYEDTVEECNRIYTGYMYCVNRCEKDGFCYEYCVDDYYPEFLECCEQFNAEVSCLQGCYDIVEVCFNDAYPLARITRENCFLAFADCCAECPVPIAAD